VQGIKISELIGERKKSGAKRDGRRGKDSRTVLPRIHKNAAVRRYNSLKGDPKGKTKLAKGQTRERARGGTAKKLDDKKVYCYVPYAVCERPSFGVGGGGGRLGLALFC